MTENPQFVKVFQNVGSWTGLPSCTQLTQMEYFVCCMYGQLQFTETSKVRSAIFESRYGVKLPQSLSATKSCGIDLSLLPPCQAALRKHCMRANYQTLIWRQAHIAYPTLPSPDGHGWVKDADGNLHIDWIEGDMIPQTLVDILEDADVEDEQAVSFEATEEDDEVDNIIDIVFSADEDDDD